MSDDLQSPNLVEKGKNLAKYTWELINYIQNKPIYLNWTVRMAPIVGKMLSYSSV